MDKINKLTLPATILIASVILGGFYYVSQLSKQRSIEKQQQIEIQAKAEQDKVKQDAIKQLEANKDEQVQSDKEAKQKMLDDCMTQAHERYEKGSISACLDAGYTETDLDNLKCKLPGYTAQSLLKTQKDEQDMCIKLYK